MSRNFKLLNDKCKDYNSEINSLKEKIKELLEQQKSNNSIMSSQSKTTIKLIDELCIAKSKPPAVVYIPAKPQTQRPFDYLFPRSFS